MLYHEFHPCRYLLQVQGKNSGSEIKVFRSALIAHKGGPVVEARLVNNSIQSTGGYD